MINTPKVWSVVPQGSAGDVDLYSVTVVVQQRPYASAEPSRAFYRVPVSIWQFQPRAMDWPVPVSDPGPGADVKAGYDHPLSPTSPVYAVVNGFIPTYLTATTGRPRRRHRKRSGGCHLRDEPDAVFWPFTHLGD